MSRIAPAALDAAAAIIAQAIGVQEVARVAFAQEPDDDAESATGLVAALSEGQSTQLGYAMGAAKPYEFEHRAAFELIAVRGSDEARGERIACALDAANAAIAADPSLGGAVDFAELEEPDPTDAERYVALSAVLTLTYTAPTALG